MAEFIICPKCGNKNFDSETYCTRCDASLEQLKKKRLREEKPNVKEQIPRKIQAAVELNGDEIPLRYWHGVLRYGSAGGGQAAAAAASVMLGTPAMAQQPMWNGILVATNQRFAFLAEKGVFTKEYSPKESIRYEHVTSIGIDSGWLAHSLTISAQMHGREWHIAGLKSQRDEFSWESANLEEARAFGEIAVKQRMAAMADQKKKERIQLVIDFSFLKEAMKKGGMVVQTVKCPNCSAPVSLPSSGSETKCQYCGAMLYAQDVFEKVRDLIGGL